MISKEDQNKRCRSINNLYLFCKRRLELKIVTMLKFLIISPLLNITRDTISKRYKILKDV